MFLVFFVIPFRTGTAHQAPLEAMKAIVSTSPGHCLGALEMLQ